MVIRRCRLHVRFARKRTWMGNLCWGCLIAAGGSLHGGVTRGWPCHPLLVIQPVGPLSVIRPSWAIDCLLDHAYVATYPYQCKPRLPCLRAEDENRRKNRVPSSAAPKKPSNNFNNTPQVPSPSMLPSQEPPPAAAPHGERAASKIKQIAMTLWRWLRTTG